MQVKVTGKRNKQRLIPFAEGLKNLMLAYTEVRDRELEAAGEWFFVRKNGNQLSTGIVYNIVKKQLSEIPMLAKRSPHVLRHSFADVYKRQIMEYSASVTPSFFKCSVISAVSFSGLMKSTLSSSDTKA